LLARNGATTSSGCSMALVAFVNAELLGGAAFAGTSASAGALSEPVISTAAIGVTMENVRATELPREFMALQ